MKKPEKLQIICVLDRSGSMHHLSSEVINSFNEFIKKQQELEGKAEVTLVLFDDQYEVVHDRLNLKKVPELTSGIYFGRGMTGLYDAIGKTINSNLKAKEAIVLMQTDGEENASQEFTKDSVKALIEAQTAKGWEFQFLGANIDAMSTGGSIGITKSNTVQFAANSRGITDAYASMNSATASYRSSAK